MTWMAEAIRSHRAASIATHMAASPLLVPGAFVLSGAGHIYEIQRFHQDLPDNTGGTRRIDRPTLLRDGAVVSLWRGSEVTDSAGHAITLVDAGRSARLAFIAEVNDVVAGFAAIARDRALVIGAAHRIVEAALAGTADVVLPAASGPIIPTTIAAAGRGGSGQVRRALGTQRTAPAGVNL